MVAMGTESIGKCQNIEGILAQPCVSTSDRPYVHTTTGTCTNTATATGSFFTSHSKCLPHCVHKCYHSIVIGD